MGGVALNRGGIEAGVGSCDATERHGRRGLNGNHGPGWPHHC